MKHLVHIWREYALAVMSPFLATIAAFALELWLPRGNLSLVYLTAVLMVAVRTGTKPALACAVISFLSYNFFFTEPQFSLFMMHREDALTAGFFLFMATLTGHLAARLREQVTVLQARDAINQAQFLLSEQFSAAIDNHEISRALYNALKKVIDGKCAVLSVEYAGHDYRLIPLAGDADAVQQYVHKTLLQTLFRDKSAEIFFGNTRYYFVVIHKKPDSIILLGLELTAIAIQRVQDDKTIINTFAQQASLALGRIQLVTELQAERFEKERELLRSALLSSISHDLRTPLAAMIGSTTSLIDLDASLNAGQKRELLDAVLQEAQRLDRYIQNLLDMTRLGYEGLRLERDWVDLGEIINITLKRIKPVLRGHKIRSQINANLPALYVHAALIEQAIFNILENAVKFSPDNSEVSINACINNTLLQIDVTDQGPGISEEQKSKIFDMFFSSPQGDRHTSGTGLGLAICQGVIHAHGGKISALGAKDGTGVTIRMLLPLCANEPPALLEEV